MSCWAVTHGPLPQSMPRGWGEECGQTLFPDVWTVSGGPRAKRWDTAQLRPSNKLLNNLEKKEAWVIKEMVSQEQKRNPWPPRIQAPVIAQDNTHGDSHYMSTQAVSLSAMLCFQFSGRTNIYMETQKVQHEKAGALWKTLTECMSWFIKDLTDLKTLFIVCVFTCHSTGVRRGQLMGGRSLPHQVISVGSKCRALILIYKLNSILSREELHLLFKFPQTKRQNRICI